MIVNATSKLDKLNSIHFDQFLMFNSQFVIICEINLGVRMLLLSFSDPLYVVVIQYNEEMLQPLIYL